MKVLPWQASSIPLEKLQDLFFQNSSRKNFSNLKEKFDFLDRWFSIYLQEWPDLAFVAMNNEEELMGYLLGCRCSSSALPKLTSKIPSYSLFSEYFEHFPAHLHINVSLSFQGKGVGKLLVDNYHNFLTYEGVTGSHAVTSLDATNVAFYEKLGFSKIDEKTFNEWQLLFMGKKLLSDQKK